MIANRGEIAVRIIKTCKRLGLKTIAVYSDADANSIHVRLADESFYLGPSNPLKSYLNIERLCEAITATKADAVHPGYGFLAESAEFAKAVNDVGAIWIGPSPTVLSNLTSKTYSRKMAVKAGVPIIPGSLSPVSYEEALRLADELGPPILIKPDRGGGGKGTRRINDVKDLTKELFDAAAREAQYAFRIPDLYVEKLLHRPKHIEVQVISDGEKTVALGERECSIQRRYQKIIEEAPSPVVDKKTRMEIYDMAKRYAETIGYTNAGTVEFLRDPSGKFFFLEMNKRIQVEHPVTEMTTGLDIVELQLRVALEGKLPLERDYEPKGHAIEARIYAEDPVTFVPSPGTITALHLPVREDVRVDHALEVGTVIPPYYDPLIAKFIAYSNERVSCIDLLKGYLESVRIEGIKTNIPFLMKILSMREFFEGSFDTTWVDELTSAGVFA